MSFVAMVTRTVIFADDIDRHIERQSVLQNAKVRTHAEQLPDSQIADVQRALGQEVKERNEVLGQFNRTDLPVDIASMERIGFDPWVQL